MKLALYH